MVVMYTIVLLYAYFSLLLNMCYILIFLYCYHIDHLLLGIYLTKEQCNIQASKNNKVRNKQ